MHIRNTNYLSSHKASTADPGFGRVRFFALAGAFRGFTYSPLEGVLRHRIAVLFLMTAALIWLLAACTSAQEQGADNPAAALKRGNYQQALDGFRRILASPASEPEAQTEAQQGILHVFLETGRYREAEDTAKGFLAAKADSTGVRILYGEALALQGKYRDAAAEFERAGNTAKDAVKLRADLRRGEMFLMVGMEDEGLKLMESVVEEEDELDETTAESQMLAARALTHLERFQDANSYYLDAIDIDEENIEAQLGGGELFTSKYNYADAAEFYTDALKINPNSARAHLGTARNKRIGGGEELQKALAKALEINPSLVEAHVLAAVLDMETEHYEAASAKLESALKVNPQSLEAHALRAALYYLQNRAGDLESEIRATLSINPRYGELYETLAQFATNTRRYQQAVEFTQKAVAIKPRLWSAHLALGTALLRTGQAEEGRRAIERSFEGDPFNIWAKNTLDLLDSMMEYKETRRGAFLIKTAPNESEVLPVYAGDLLEEVSRTLAAKYRFTPREPIWVEFFPNHDDFAVRTLGLPGLGALGVCFGQVIAQDSPSARRSGEFNWGSTLWHEYTHVVTLQITDHLIPRWFSEGLSVYEERRARPGWGDDWNIGNLRAFGEGRWFKISEIDAGFMRPKRPDDVSLAYFQASHICEFITDKYGFEAILDMLRQYRERKKTPEILRQTLKLSESEFDSAFKEYIESRVGVYVKVAESIGKAGSAGQIPKDAILAEVKNKPDDFLYNLRAGTILNGEGDVDGAIPYLKRSIEIFPYQTGAGSAFELLSTIYEKREDRAEAIKALEGLLKVDENNYSAILRLAQLRQELGDKKGALEALRMGFYVNPFESAPHTTAGTLLLELNQPEAAIREYRVALALSPPNPAEAHYNLASALFAAGQKAEARRAVLRSLEAAPGYEQAQELLLRIARP